MSSNKTSRRRDNFADQPRKASGSDVRDRKRDKFKEEESGLSTRNIFVGVAIVLVMLAGYWFYSGKTSPAVAGTAPGGGSTSPSTSNARRANGTFTEVKLENGAMRLPVANLADGKAKYFTYKGKDKEIDFFVMKSSDGVVRAAIDACDVCYSFKKGYRQEGDEMVCNNCGQRFPSIKINEVQGGCNPSPLTRSVDGDSVVIKEADIQTNGNFYF